MMILIAVIGLKKKMRRICYDKGVIIQLIPSPELFGMHKPEQVVSILPSSESKVVEVCWQVNS